MPARYFGVYGRLPTLNQPATLSKRRFSALGDVVVEYAGGAIVGGFVKVGAAPVVRRVVLFDKRSFQPVRVTVSADDGSYAFAGLNPALEKRFMAIAVDHTMTYEPAVADNLTPEL